MTYLEGESILPRTSAEAKSLIGMRVKYLEHSGIDKSGRGYFSPVYGTIAGVHGKNIAIDYPENFCIHLSQIAEMVKA